MRILIDTNILVRVMQLNSPQRDIASRAIGTLRGEQHELHTVPQVLYEYWAVATRSAEHNGLGFSVEQVSQHLLDWQELCPALRDEIDVVTPWTTLVSKHRVLGKQAHDAHLVAAMLQNELSHLLTFNGVDFTRYPIEVLDPHSLGKV